MKSNTAIKIAIAALTSGVLVWQGLLKYNDFNDKKAFDRLDKDRQALVLRLEKDNSLSKEVIANNVRNYGNALDALERLDIAKTKTRAFLDEAKKEYETSKKEYETAKNGAFQKVDFPLGRFTNNYKLYLSKLTELKEILQEGSNNIMYFDKSKMQAAIEEIDGLLKELRDLNTQVRDLVFY